MLCAAEQRWSVRRTLKNIPSRLPGYSEWYLVQDLNESEWWQRLVKSSTRHIR
jgi:hypothetical protein